MIFSLEGHDRTGKTTLAAHLGRVLCAEIPDRWKYFRSTVPKDADRLRDWLRNAPVDEVISEHIIMYKQREEACLSTNKVYVLVRGYLSLLGGSLASIMRKENCDILSAFQMFEDMRNRLEYRPRPCMTLFLHMPVPLQQCINTIESRDGAPLAESYKAYLRLFVVLMQIITAARTDICVLNALDSPANVLNEALAYIERQANL